MRSVTAVLGLALTIFMGTTAVRVAADDNAWLVLPPLVKEVSAADREVRDELAKVIAARQTKASRDGWNLEVPERASGVPTKYDLVLHRSNGCFTDTRARLEIQVRNGRARWELCELSGIYRTDRPAADVDRLVRQLAYAFHAVERPGKERNWSISFSVGPPPHYIEVVSRDNKSPFHLQPDHPQVEHNSSGRPTDRIRNYAFAVLVEHVFNVAERECQLISAEEVSREVLRRLKSTPALVEGEKLTSGRRDQIEVERSLYGDMAVKHCLSEALPELKRLFLIDEERQLQIAVAADPKPLVLQAIANHEKDLQLAAWAVSFAADDRHPDRLAWLCDVLPRLEKDPPAASYVDAVLFALDGKKLTKEQLVQLAARFDQTKNLMQKIGVAQVLLQHTHEGKYFSYLDSLVRSLPPDADANSRGPRRTATRHLLSYAVETGRQRSEARSLLKKLLQEPLEKQRPDSFEMFELVELLGDLGTPEDVPYLAGLAQTGSPYLMSFATSALANLVAKRALEVLHERIDRWNKLPADELAYSHEICSHFELIIFERDVAAVPLLKKAWEQLSTRKAPKENKKADDPNEILLFDTSDDSEPTSEGYNPAHVIAFLEAKTGSARAEAAIAHFGDRAHYEDRTRMRRLVDQLIAEGADPQRCKLLLHDPEDPRRGR